MTTMVIFVLLCLLFTSCTSNTIDCFGTQSCKDDTKTCNSGEPCDITCDGTSNGEQACQDATLNGSSATNVTLDCIHKQDCQGSELICGTGICSIHCHTNTHPDHVEQCKFTTVDCAESICKIQCDGPKSCFKGSEFVLTNAISFECSGDCPPSYPSPTIKPTNIPTVHPTKAPIIIPTNIPTKYPTNFPTKYPTNFPTSFPSKYDTLAPTETPTERPTRSVSTNTTEYSPQNNDGRVTHYVTTNIGEIMGSEDAIFDINTILENTALVIICSLIIMVLICMIFTCIFYVYKMKKKKQKRISDKSVENKKQKYNNIPMNVSNSKDKNDNTELVKTESLSENIAFKNESPRPTEGCTAIQMGELDVSEDENNELVNDDEFIIQTNSHKNKKLAINHFKTPSNSFSNGDKIDINLNDGEFIIDGDSVSIYDGKQRKITEGY
eukprot:484002_1